METFRYIEGTATLVLEVEACIGCGRCVVVCPHRLFHLEQGKAQISDPDLCMECGACRTNCPSGAIRVSPGVGCAAHIIARWVNGALGKKVIPDCC